MKLSRSKPRWTAIACMMLACVLALPAVAFAGLSDPTHGTSTTNPNVAPEEFPNGNGSEQPPSGLDWRQGWGNSLYPEFTYDEAGIPQGDGGRTLGYIYSLTRPQFQSMPSTSAARWDVSWDPTGLLTHHVLDLQGIWNGLSPAERSYISTPGQIAHDPREGLWCLNVRFFNQSVIATGYSYEGFGLDLTPPRRVMGFTSGVTVPTETTRRKFTWVNQEYDDMSRGAWYELYINDMRTPVRHIQILPWMPGAATIEDLPPGKNTVGIRVMDRATNEGPMVTHTEVVDPDYPYLAVSPGSGAYVRGTTIFSAVASDSAGITKVTFALDGVLKQSSATARTYSVNTTKISAGKHTLQVCAYDLFGHVRTVNDIFYVDNVAPSFSSISDSPDPWYPCIQDGYKDVATFKGSVSEYVTDLFWQLYDEDGKTLKAEGHKANFAGGSFSFTFDGKDKSTHDPMDIGPMGSYKILKWRFTAKDRAGNWRNLPMQTIEVRNYEIVSNPNGGVKVVPR